MLSVAGEALRRQLGMDCNVFGGVAECRPLPPDSAFVKQCKGHNHEVHTAAHGYTEPGNRLACGVALRHGVHAGVWRCFRNSSVVSCKSSGIWSVQIDCAYAATVDDEEILQGSPVDAFKATLDRQQLDDIQSGCPRCFSNLQVRLSVLPQGAVQ